MKQVMIILTALTVLTVCSCISKTMYDAPAGILFEASPLQQIEQKLDKNETATRKIIKEGKITFRTADVDQTKALIVQTVQELRIENEGFENYSNLLAMQVKILSCFSFQRCMAPPLQCLNSLQFLQMPVLHQFLLRITSKRFSHISTRLS